jgi:hypothetical protein
MKTKTYAILCLVMLLIACQKEKQVKGPDLLEAQDLSLDQVKAFYKPPVMDTLYWGKAVYKTGNRGNYWLIGQSGRPLFGKLKLGYRSMVFYLDSVTHKITGRRLEVIPDVLYLQRSQQVNEKDFTGHIFVYDLGQHLLYGYIYKEGKVIGKIKPADPVKSNLQVNKSIPVTECAWVSENYVDSDGNAVIYSQQVCSTSTFDLDGIGSDDGVFGGSAPTTGEPGKPPVGGGGSGAAPAPAVSNLPGESKSGITPKDYMNCFQIIPDNGATMKITIYVQEPWPGTTFNVGSNSVGHTAISLTKTNGSSSITQTVGFYPDATGFSKMHAPSKLVDNGGDLDYNVSISYDVTAENFNKIVNYISSPPPTYDLADFNCTNFVNSACLAGNISLPNPVTVSPFYPSSAVLTPAALGDSIEQLKGNSNVNTDGGNVPLSHGPCN